MSINLKPLVVFMLLTITACHQSTDANTPTLEEQAGTHIGDNYHAGRDININYQKSEEYQDLITQRDKLREKVKQYPNDLDFPKDLAEIEKKITAFERNILQLAATINSIPRTSERLKQAILHFEAGEFAKARAVLDIAEITKDQEALLKQQEAVKAKLETNANELILLAQATAVDYKLGEQRIPQTQAYFEQALKSARSADNVFNYAKFLQENNQFKLAEQLFQEALQLRRQLAKDNPQVYTPYVATTLNNLGSLVAKDSQRRSEAEQLFQEALTTYRQLAKDNPQVYTPYVATTLNNLGALVSDDSQRRKEAEQLFQEALQLRRQLAKDNPQVYTLELVDTLGAYGLALLNWENAEKAQPILKEAAELLAPLAKDYPNIYGDKQASILLIASEAVQETEYTCKAMQEALAVAQTEALKKAVQSIIDQCKQDGLIQ